MNDVALVAVRWALYVDLGLLFGLPLFALYAPGGGRMVQRHLPMVAMVAGLACLALLLSALGFALQAAAMTGLPLTQPDLSMVAELFNGTSMGTALKARLVALLVLLLSIPFYRRQSRPAFIASTLAGAVTSRPSPGAGMARPAKARRAGCNWGRSHPSARRGRLGRRACRIPCAGSYQARNR
jgi:putative copper resistance protein D